MAATVFNLVMLAAFGVLAAPFAYWILLALFT